VGVSSVGSDKRCRVCGDELECLDYGGGSVWSCDVHGVRDWLFDAGGPSLGLIRELPHATLSPRGPRRL
jgi:hypothetical protein